MCVSVCARMCNREQEYLWFIGTIGFLDSSVLQPHRSYDLRDIGSEDPHNSLVFPDIAVFLRFPF